MTLAAVSLPAAEDAGRAFRVFRPSRDILER